MPAHKKKHVFIGVSGIAADTAHLLRQRARANNRSVSGEIRTIIEAELSCASIDARQTQNHKTHE